MLPRRFLKLFGFESRLNRRERLPRRVPLQLERLEDRTLLSGNLTLNLSAPSTAVAGAGITYTIAISNTGTSAVSNVELTDTLPSGVSYNSQTYPSGSGVTPGVSGNSIDDVISSLAAGASATFSVVGTIASSTSNGATLSDTATATGSGVSSASGSVSTTVANSPSLSISLTAPSTAAVGASITYSITVTNSGSGDAPSVAVTDALPSGVTYSSQTQPSGQSWTLGESLNTINDTISSLAAGASATFSVVGAVGSISSSGTTVSDTAAVTCGGVSSGSASVSTAVSLPSTSTTATSSAGTSAPGQAVAFTAVVQGAIAGTPTGTVTFMYGGATLGTATLSQYGAVIQARLIASIPTAGTYAITAVYGGDANFAGSTSAPLNQVVRAPTDEYWTDATGDHNASDPSNWSAGRFVAGDRLIVDGVHAPRSNDALTFDVAPTDANGRPLLAGMSIVVTYTARVDFTASPDFTDAFSDSSSAPVTITGPVSIGAPNITLWSSAVVGPNGIWAPGGGTVIVGGGTSLSGMKLTISAGSTWILGAATLDNGAVIANYGQGTWNDANVALNNGSAIENFADFKVTCDQAMTTVGGGAFWNGGAFEKDVAAIPNLPGSLSLTDMQVKFYNWPAGGGLAMPSVTVRSNARLGLSGGGADAAPYTINSSAELDFGGGNERKLYAGTSFAGEGVFLVFAAAHAHIVDGSIVLITTSTFTLSGFGPLTTLVGTPSPLAPPGTPRGTFIISSTDVNWNGDAGLEDTDVFITGALIIGDSVPIFALQATMLNANLWLQGTTTWSSVRTDIGMDASQIVNTGIFTVANGRAIVDKNPPTPQTPQPTSFFINDGTVSKTAGTTPTLIGVVFVNQGALDFNGTTITFQEDVQQTAAAAFTDLGGGTMALTAWNLVPGTANATTFQLSAGELTGLAGATINGSLLNGGTVDFGSAFGTLTITGNYTQVAGAALDINTSTTSGTDLVQVAGQASLGGFLHISGGQAEAVDILQAAGGVAGAFSDLTTPWTVLYLANDIWVH